jgi:two-component system sensor histidine kinase and response regulator WspE
MTAHAGLPDQFLLDLFREEVRSNVRTLNEGLVGIEQIPDDTRLVEPLMRAAHSIKGAARVVAIDAGVRLAHSMEDLLVAAQKSQLKLTSGHVDLLLRGVDLLDQIGTAAGPSLGVWLAGHSKTVDALVRDLDQTAAGQPVNAAPASADTRPSETFHVDAPVRSPNSSESLTYATGSLAADRMASPTKPAPTTASAPAPGNLAADAHESPMIELFCNETRRQSQALIEGLAELKQNPANTQCLERLFVAARSAKGAAFVVNVTEAIQLGQAAEQLIQSARDGRCRIGAEALRALREAADLMGHIADAVGNEYSQWQASNGSLISDVIARLAHASIVSSGEPSTKSTASSSPDSKPAAPAKGAEAAPAGNAERVVRVTPQSLTRLMGLAGESLVEARWLPVFANSLLKLKKLQAQTRDLLDEVGQLLADSQVEAQALGMLEEARKRLLGCQTELAGRISEFETHARQSDDLNSRLYHEVIASRMRPLADGVHGFPRMVRDLARQLGKRVQFEIVGQSTPVDRDILEKLESPLNHILRNALDHGMETPEERTASGKSEVGQLRLTARHTAGMLSISVTDDGRGIDIDRLRYKVVERGHTNHDTASRMSEAELLEFLFLPGFSTREKATDVSGRGVGLDVVHSMVHGVGGTVRIQSQLGRGTTFHLQLPITLSVIRAVLVKVAGDPYALPHNRIDRLFRLPRAALASLEHRQFCNVDGRNVGMVMGRQVFQLADEGTSVAATDGGDRPANDELNVVLFSNHNDQYGLVVDEFHGEQDLVVRPLDPRLGKVPNVQAAAILDDGSPILIVDLDDLRVSIERLLKTGKLQRTDQAAPGVRFRVSAGCWSWTTRSPSAKSNASS